MPASARAPALFIGHGSPMNAIEDNDFSAGWRAIAQRFPKPEAIVVASAHWAHDGVRVTAQAQPKTIHDFGGSFPDALRAVQYPAPGAPILAEVVAEMLRSYRAQAVEDWGLDHGTWSVLRWMYPEADVPVIQVSLDARGGAREHYAMGAALAPLRDDGVLIVGSGNIVHNLQVFFRAALAPQDWRERFDEAVVTAAKAHDHAALMRYPNLPDAAIAAPDWDHFMPLFVALGAGGRDAVEPFNRGYLPGISMTSLALGLPVREGDA
jgi:4,5-DOPA dioxygenase extradiol